jgi:hypothetical protein
MLSSMLDGLKDEKKGSLVVADPKLGMFYIYVFRRTVSNHENRG